MVKLARYTKEQRKIRRQPYLPDGEQELVKIVPPRAGESPAVRRTLIGLALAFVGLMLVLPLVLVLTNSLKNGLAFYWQAVTARYARSALKVTAIATLTAVGVNTALGLTAAWLLTKFDFRGRSLLSTCIDIPFSISPVIAGLAFIMTFGRMGWAAPLLAKVNAALGTDIALVFSIPGVVLATIFVTFPFVSRELIPVLNAQGRDEEEAAALMGAGGFTIFRRVTFPHIRWALLYGVILCTARAMGEFGAVYALSKTRGKTFTLPLEVDALYMAGGEASITQAFAVSSLLVVLALALLVLRNIVEYRGRKSGELK